MSANLGIEYYKLKRTIRNYNTEKHGMNEDKYKGYKELKERHRKIIEERFNNNTSIQSKLKLHGIEKLYFHIWFALKNPPILVHFFVSITAIVICLYQKWQLEIILAIFSIGVISVLAEDFITVLFVKKFRTKYYKNHGKELTSKTHSKGEVLHKMVLSGVFTLILLYFVNDKNLLSNWNALSSLLPALAYAGFIWLISTVRLILVLRNSQREYDLSLTMGRRIFQPLGLFLLLWFIFGLEIFSSTTGAVLFLIIYAVIRYFGLVFSSFMTLDDKGEEKLEAEARTFIDKIRRRRSA